MAKHSRKPSKTVVIPAASGGLASHGAHAATGGSSPCGSHAASKRRSSGGPWRVVFIVSMVVFVVALAVLAAIGFSYWQGQQTNKEIEEIGFTAPDSIDSNQLGSLTVDWDALRAINPDTIGWIYIPGTSINYPIVQGEDDSFYLKHDFKGSTGWIATFGAIFLEAENKSDFSDANNIIYGHHLNDGSMFAPIAGFSDADTFNANRTIYILTPKGNYRLTTFSLVHCAANDPIAQMTFSDNAERVSYIQDKIDRSVVSVSDVPAADNMKRTFALSTCDNLASDGRWVLFAYVSASTSSAAAGQDLNAIANDEDAAAVDDAVKETIE